MHIQAQQNSYWDLWDKLPNVVQCQVKDPPLVLNVKNRMGEQAHLQSVVQWRGGLTLKKKVEFVPVWFFSIRIFRYKGNQRLKGGFGEERWRYASPHPFSFSSSAALLGSSGMSQGMQVCILRLGFKVPTIDRSPLFSLLGINILCICPSAFSSREKCSWGISSSKSKERMSLQVAGVFSSPVFLALYSK